MKIWQIALSVCSGAFILCPLAFVASNFNTVVYRNPNGFDYLQIPPSVACLMSFGVGLMILSIVGKDKSNE